MRIVSDNTLFKNMTLYALSDSMGKILHFLLLPIYTFFLSTSDYGIQNMIICFNSVLSYAILLCLDSAALRFFSENLLNEEILKRFYGTALMNVGGLSVIVVSICCFLHSTLEEYIFIGVDFFPYILIGLAILVFDAIYTLHRRILEAKQQGKKVAAFNLFSIIFSSISTLIMIGVMKLGVLGVLCSTLLTSCFTLLFTVLDIYHNNMLIVCYDKKLSRQMVSYSLPLIPHYFSRYLSIFVVRIFLNIDGSLAMVGIYTIATQFVSIIDIFQDAVSRAFRPWLFSILSNQMIKEYKLKILGVCNILISLCSIIVVGVSLFSQEIVSVMTSTNYFDAWKLIPILAIAESIKSIYYLYLAQCLFYLETARWVFLASLVANIFNVVSAAILIPSIGMYGSAIASVISIIVNTIIIYSINRRNGFNLFPVIALIKRLVISWGAIIFGIIPSIVFGIQDYYFIYFLGKISLMICYLMTVMKMNYWEFENLHIKKIKDLMFVMKG